MPSETSEKSVVFISNADAIRILRKFSCFHIERGCHQKHQNFQLFYIERGCHQKLNKLSCFSFVQLFALNIAKYLVRHVVAHAQPLGESLTYLG